MNGNVTAMYVEITIVKIIKIAKNASTPLVLHHSTFIFLSAKKVMDNSADKKPRA